MHMDETIIDFGFNAGKVWTTLNIKGSLNEESLVQCTKLDPDELSIAIGWLARENKIRKDDVAFQLGTTNLTVKIGKDAGKVWKVLHIWEDIDPLSIATLARINEQDVYAALGWLSRENKVQTTMMNTTNKQVLFRLK